MHRALPAAEVRAIHFRPGLARSGATWAYAVTAYSTPTADFFEYQDGAMRDRVDETKVFPAWLALGKQLLAAFELRLEQVRRQRDAADADTAQWGAVPARWQWT